MLATASAILHMIIRDFIGFCCWVGLFVLGYGYLLFFTGCEVKSVMAKKYVNNLSLLKPLEKSKLHLTARFLREKQANG